MSKNKKIIITSVIVLIIIVISGSIFAYHKNQQQAEQGLEYIKNDSNDAKIASLTKNDLIKLTILNAYRTDKSTWKKLYKELENSKLIVKQARHFNSDENLTPASGEVLYLLNDKYAILIPKTSISYNSNITLASHHKHLQEKAGLIYTKNKEKINSIKNSGDEFSNKQIAVMAYVYKNSDSPEEQLDDLISKAKSSDTSDDKPMGIKEVSSNKYIILEGPGPVNKWTMEFESGDNIDISCEKDGQTTFQMTGNKSGLIKRYGDYKAQINELISLMEKNGDEE